jgi:hypothetical protein
MTDTLETVGKLVMARKAKIARLEQKIDTHEEVRRWKQEIEDHRIAIKQHLIEAHRRIVLNQELKDEGITWDKWVKANCSFTRKQSYKIMGLTGSKKKPVDQRAESGAAAPGPKSSEPQRPAREEPEEVDHEEPEEDDHELKDWVATFESWSRDRQQIGLNFVASEESELRGLVDLKEMLIVELKKKIGQIEQENQSLRERLAAPQPEPAEPEPEEAPRPASEPSEPQAIEAIITWDRPAQIALFAMLHEHLNAIEPPAEQIERPEQQPVAPAEHAPPPPPPAAPAEPPPMKSREETIAAFEKSGRLGLGDWQQKLMHIDAAVVEALITEGLLAAENDDRVRIIQPWMMPAA